MRVPERLEPLLDHGIIQEVVRPLMSGKEARVYLVIANGEQRVAKVYKEATDRTFKHRSEYTEGRRVRNSRDQRAMNKRSRYGRQLDEQSWHAAEVDIIYRLRAAGVRVPKPYDFADGVLVMELITDGAGNPAPRLADVTLTVAEARKGYEQLLAEVVKMVCAGVIHGDLSDFNVLMGPDGPVIIDFPQSVDPSRNQNARKLLIRDVHNLTLFLRRFVPRLRQQPYAQEIWDLYERSLLTPQTELTGRYQPPKRKSNTDALLDEIAAVERESRERRVALGLEPVRKRRKPCPLEPSVPEAPELPEATPGEERAASKKGRRRRRRAQPAAAGPGAASNRGQPRGRPKKPPVEVVRVGAGYGTAGGLEPKNASGVEGSKPRNHPPTVSGNGAAAKDPNRPRPRRRRRRRKPAGAVAPVGNRANH